MKMILDILNRSKINLTQEKENINIHISTLVEEIEMSKVDIEAIDIKLNELDKALRILIQDEVKDVAATSKSKKVKRISSNS